MDKFEATPSVGYHLAELDEEATEDQDKSMEMDEGAQGGVAHGLGAMADGEPPPQGRQGSSEEDGQALRAGLEARVGSVAPEVIENLGGHDEFMFDDNFDDSDVQMDDTSQPQDLSRAEASFVKAGEEQATDDEEEDEEGEGEEAGNASDKASQDEEGEASQDDEDSEAGDWRFGNLKLGDSGEEAADVNHQRPESRATSYNGYEEETQEEYQARQLAQGQQHAPFTPTGAFAPTAARRNTGEESGPPAELPFQRPPLPDPPEADEDELWPDMPGGDGGSDGDGDGRDGGGEPGFQADNDVDKDDEFGFGGNHQEDNRADANRDEDDDVELPDATPPPLPPQLPIFSGTAPKAVKHHPG
ncbi:hypothetical protein P7C70_g6160, partial [Phenoliferia sp. Uapishka_3]